MRAVESEITQDSTTSPTPTRTVDEHQKDAPVGDSILQVIRAAAPSQPSPLATESISHQQLPTRSPSPPNIPSSGASSSRGTQSRQTSYDDDQETPTESAEEDDVEIIIEPTPVPSERDTVSVAGSENHIDSSKHFGNGVTCRYYNKNRCGKGNTCPYSHAPDLYSLRSHPEGRNVCIYFIHNNKCRFKDQKCNYSHNRDDLRWSDDEIPQRLEDKLNERKNELNAQKEEKKAARTRRHLPPPASPRMSNSHDTLTISGPLMEIKLPDHPPANGSPAKGKRPSKRGSYAAGVNMYPARWDLPQQVDRMQLLRFGVLTYEQPIPIPYFPYNPFNGYPIG